MLIDIGNLAAVMYAMTPAERAEFNAAYDALAAELKRRLPTPQAEARYRARLLFERLTFHHEGRQP
jgi:hypothetical protein